MKWYSEEELKKWMGHALTFPLLEQMEYKNLYLCSQCEYWEPPKESPYIKLDMGICRILKKFTHSDEPCFYPQRSK